MDRRVLAAGAVAIAAIGSALWFWRGSDRPLERVVLAESRQVMSALVYVAQAEGMFAREGLDVEIRPHASGKESLESLIAGTVDFAACSDVPLSRAIMAGRPAQVFATIETSNRDLSILARRDRGIDKPGDLAGKRIGFMPGTNSEYFLRLFTIDQGLTDAGIVKVPFPTAKAADALVSGDVDALSAWTTVRLKAQKALPNGTNAFFAAPIYTESWTLNARPDVLRDRPEMVQSLLRALIAAEKFVAANPERAKDIVSKGTGLEPATVAEIWDTYGFTVRLDQTLLASIEAQIRYALEGQPSGTRPDVFSGLHLDALATVDRSRVTVVH